jgi:hypothetical protein
MPRKVGVGPHVPGSTGPHHRRDTTGLVRHTFDLSASQQSRELPLLSHPWGVVERGCRKESDPLSQIRYQSVLLDRLIDTVDGI